MERNKTIALIQWLEKKPNEERLQLLTTLITAYLSNSGKDIPTAERVSQKVLADPKLILGDTSTEDEDEKEFIFFFLHSLEHLQRLEEAESQE